MTICKYCLASKYNINFTKVSPNKREIIKAIFSCYKDKSYFKGKSHEDILEIFFKEEAYKFENISMKQKKNIRKKVLAGTRVSS